MTNVFEETLASANNGNPLAQHDLGVMYGKGIYVEQDMSQSLEWFRKAAFQGQPEAVRMFREFADQGLDIAQYHLGVMYANGQGVERDSKEATRWYRKAADNGMREAKANLGIMYYFGQGVEQDYTEALKFCCQAAEEGDNRAQFLVDAMYAEGHGVSPDVKAAELWLLKSAEQGNVRAQASLGQCTLQPKASYKTMRQQLSGALPPPPKMKHQRSAFSATFITMD
jgi:TPR repeat protein